MKDGRNGLPPEYSKDGVHPNPEGYRVMEGIIASYLR
jgi:lysophospholipase L1-like esterase